MGRAGGSGKLRRWREIGGGEKVVSCGDWRLAGGRLAGRQDALRGLREKDAVRNPTLGWVGLGPVRHRVFYQETV